jgi:hypothetical protein
MLNRFAVALLFAAVSVHAGEKNEIGSSLHARVIATYNFLPREIDDKAIEAKSKELDAFWNDVKARGPQGLEELRQELRRPDLPVFFNYDGAKLLLSLSKTREDRRLALTAIGRAELRDVQWNDYFFTVHALAVDGFDTSDAALKILDENNFKVFVPQHALTLGQDFCLLYLLLPTDESFYLDKLVRRLSEEKRTTALKSILLVLGYSVTSKGDDAIKRFAEDNAKPEEPRAYAGKIMHTTKSMAQAPRAGLAFSSYKTLKAGRRKLLARVSDEALYELEDLQAKLRSKKVP